MAVMAGLAAGVVGAAGSIYSGRQSANAAESNYKHRYQWQVEDLKKAGLNPMLAYQNGAPNVPQPEFPNPGEAAIRGYASAVAARLQKEQYESQKATTQGLNVDNETKEANLLILKSSPLYQDALKNYDHARGIEGPSAIASERFTAELNVVKEQASNLVAERGYKELQTALTQRDIDLKDIQIKFAPELARIETAYRSAMQKAAAAGVPAAEADAAFWEDAGVLGKVATFIRNTLGPLPTK